MTNIANCVSTETPPPVLLDPRRCRFFFSDGRRCRQPRSLDHPALCAAHARGDEDAFSYDLAPLSGEFKTATQINRALGKVFTLLAQNRIPRRNAVALGYIAQLLLQTLPAVKEELIAGLGYQTWKKNLDSALCEEEEEEEEEEENEPESAPESDASDAQEIDAPSEAHREAPLARAFSESALADSEGPGAFAALLGTPISRLASDEAPAEAGGTAAARVNLTTPAHNAGAPDATPDVRTPVNALASPPQTVAAPEPPATHEVSAPPPMSIIRMAKIARIPRFLWYTLRSEPEPQAKTNGNEPPQHLANPLPADSALSETTQAE